MLDLIDQSTGESLMRWTIRFAVACVLLRFATRLARVEQRIPSTSECSLWATGYFLYCCHVVLAFHFIHHWSHDQAWQHTAQETARLTGINRGEGIWANYAFTFIWGLDVVRLVIARMHHRPTSRFLDVTSFLVFAFMILNATVVFGPGHYRMIAIPTFLVMFLAWWRGIARRSKNRMLES